MLPQIASIALFLSQIASPYPEAMIYPINTASVVNPYRAPETEYSPGHRGIDLQGNLDQEVLAPVSGAVSFAGQVGFRQLITIEFGDKKVSLEPVCSTLIEGDAVTQGQVIGTICQISPDYHWHCELCLHFGVSNQNGYLSPEMFINGMSPSRLLP
jgi:murein DD-endopeptidase MepM/ murein hydrolase activator NlpD